MGNGPPFQAGEPEWAEYDGRDAPRVRSCRQRAAHRHFRKGPIMLGALAGDIIGSVHEFGSTKTKDFPLFVAESAFTDDSVMTAAVALAILTRKPYAIAMRTLGRAYPDAGYGGWFIGWLAEDDAPAYDSWGNGSAMRVSPIGFAFSDHAAVLAEAERTAVVSHSHPEGVKGAQATALAVRLARDGAARETIRTTIASRFGYDLSRTVDQIRPGYSFDVSCQGTVPEAIIAFLDSTSFEDAIRNAVSLGGDADTLACITGAIAEAYYEYGEGKGGARGISAAIREEVVRRLDEDLLEILRTFYDTYGR
jgi:ADP-ribosylglycohydrolase